MTPAPAKGEYIDRCPARLRMKAISAFMSPLLFCKAVAYSCASVFTGPMVPLSPTTTCCESQGWIGSLCLTVERELFGQAPLSEIYGPTVGNQLAKEIARLEKCPNAARRPLPSNDDKEPCSS